MYRAICDNTLRYSILRELRRFTCGGGRRAHRGEKAFWGASAAGVLPQVYRAICSNTLKHRWLRELRRFTCEGGWRAHRSEKAFSGTFAAEVLPQVYRAICSNTLKHRGLQELHRFTCGGISIAEKGLVHLRKGLVHLRKGLVHLRKGWFTCEEYRKATPCEKIAPGTVSRTEATIWGTKRIAEGSGKPRVATTTSNRN